MAAVCLQEPFINRSIPSVNENFSLRRTYLFFRSFGMRHLIIVDENNSVVGILTRKDLMGFNIVRKLDQLKQSRDNVLSILPAVDPSSHGKLA